MTKIESICVFGDSTAWGAWDRELGGWVNRLWLHLSHQEKYQALYNLSISGGTTKTILERFEHEAKVREADALIFQTGANDALYEGTPDNVWIKPEEFRQNVVAITTRAKAITPNVLLLGSKNFDEAKTLPVAWGDFYYTSANVKKYGELMRQICNEQKVLFLDMWDLLDVQDDFDDGLHPNTQGHQKIFLAVRDFLSAQKWI